MVIGSISKSVLVCWFNKIYIPIGNGVRITTLGDESGICLNSSIEPTEFRSDDTADFFRPPFDFGDRKFSCEKESLAGDICFGKCRLESLESGDRFPWVEAIAAPVFNLNLGGSGLDNLFSIANPVDSFGADEERRFRGGAWSGSLAAWEAV
jgi:hypothetical protein